MPCTPQVQMRVDGASTGTASLLCRTPRVCGWKQEKTSAFPFILPLSSLLALHNYLCAGRGKSKIIKASPAAEKQICCWSGALLGNPNLLPAALGTPITCQSPQVPQNPQINKARLRLECEPAQDSIDPSSLQRAESVMGWDEPGLADPRAAGDQ